jgi:hypothetical protein
MIRHRHLFTGLLTALLLGSASAGPAAEIDKYLPEDTETILTVNVRQILDSPLIKKHALAAARDALKNLDEVQDVLKDLGFDPFKDLDRVIMAGPGGTEKDRGLLIVHGTFDLEKFKAKGEEANNNNGDILKIHKVPDGRGGQHLVYEVDIPDQDLTLFVALASKDTLLASPGKDYVVDALKKTGRTARPVLANKEFQALLEKIDSRQSLSVAIVQTPAGQKALKGLPADVKGLAEKIVALGGGFTLTEDLKLEIAITTKTAAEAQEMRESIDNLLKLATAGVAVLAGGQKDNPALDFALEILKSARITGKGQTILVKGRLNSDYIEDALKKDR